MNPITIIDNSIKQTNVENRFRSEELLKRFEEIATKDNIESIKPQSTSIFIKCKCGCTHIEHFNVPLSETHYLRHYVELCKEHQLHFE